jgi:hypothetical protein
MTAAQARTVLPERDDARDKLLDLVEASIGIVLDDPALEASLWARLKRLVPNEGTDVQT